MGRPTSPGVLQRTVVVALERDAVVVDGPDAVEFLQGQLSQDMAALGLGESAPSLLLQPTGKVDAWLRATRLADDAVALDVDAGHGPALEARLRRFLLRTKATLTPERWTGVALRGPGQAEVVVAGGRPLPITWPGLDGTDVLGPDGVTTEAPLEEVGVLDALRVASGVPAPDREVTDATIPAELGQWLIDASVSFTKGCYTGQELVARIDSRGGRVPHPIRGLRIDGPVPDVGSVVRHGDADVGRLTSVATIPELGTIALAPLARAAAPGTAVTVRRGEVDQSAVVAELPLR